MNTRDHGYALVLAGAIADLGEFVDGPPLNEDSALPEDVAFDSIAWLDLLARLEDRFDVELAADRLPEIRTVGDLARWTAAQLPADRESPVEPSDK